MTLTFEHYLDRVKVNYHVRYLLQRSLRWKVIVSTQTHARTLDRGLCLDHWNGR